MSTLEFEASSRSELPLLIVFADLTRYSAQSLRVSDEQLAETMDGHYERVARYVESANGKVVKFIGDAALAVFAPDAADRAVQALLELKEEVDQSFDAIGWECRLMVKVHFGTAIAGPFGGCDGKRFDVLGDP
jgi:class 3 adenylate cyclase